MIVVNGIRYRAEDAERLGLVQHKMRSPQDPDPARKPPKKAQKKAQKQG